MMGRDEKRAMLQRMKKLYLDTAKELARDDFHDAANMAKLETLANASLNNWLMYTYNFNHKKD